VKALEPSRAVAHDPAIDAEDAKLLQSRGVLVPSVDWRREDLTNNGTVLFAPHCDAEVYSEALAWLLQLCTTLIVVGNSISKLRDNQARGANRCWWSLPVVSETTICSPPGFNHASFNDLSIHVLCWNGDALDESD